MGASRSLLMTALSFPLSLVLLSSRPLTLTAASATGWSLLMASTFAFKTAISTGLAVHVRFRAATARMRAKEEKLRGRPIALGRTPTARPSPGMSPALRAPAPLAVGLVRKVACSRQRVDAGHPIRRSERFSP